MQIHLLKSAAKSSLRKLLFTKNISEGSTECSLDKSLYYKTLYPAGFSLPKKMTKLNTILSTSNSYSYY